MYTSDGILGIDNLDFTATTLDRARARGRVPPATDWEMHQMSKHFTASAPTQTRQLSMAVSMTDLRRMMDMIKAG